MSPATKQKAMDKLNKFSVKVGYPDQWKDYSALEIIREVLYTVIFRILPLELQ